MLHNLSLFLPYAVFLSLPIIALTKGKGTVILLILLSLALGIRAKVMPALYLKIKDYKHPLCWAVVFLGWCGLSILWLDANAIEAGIRYLRLIGLLGMGGIAYAQLRLSSPETQHHFYKAFRIGYFVYLAFYLLEITTNNFWKGYNHNLLLRGVVILSILLWPYLGRYKKKSLQVLCLIGFLWLIYGVSPDAAFLATAIASIVYFSPMIIQKVLLTGMLLGGVMTPWISKYFLNEAILFDHMRFIPTSHQHRIFMWEELTNYIFQKPILGHGFDFAAFIKSPKLLCNHYVTEILQTRFASIKPLITYEGGGRICDGSLLFGIHPHNGFLQIWIELGGVGILLFSIFSILFYRSIQYNRLAVAMLTFYGIIFSISFNIWQNWMISTLWLGAMCLFVVKHRQKAHIRKEESHVSP